MCDIRHNDDQAEKNYIILTISESQKAYWYQYVNMAKFLWPKQLYSFGQWHCSFSMNVIYIYFFKWMLLHDLLEPFCSPSVQLSETQNSLSVKSYGRFNVIRSSDLLFTAYNLFVSFSKLFLCQTVNYRIDRAICYPSVRHEKVNVSL